jgi:serine/threonine-protein kinase
MSVGGLSRIGPYEIQREIGRGGMGVVYLGRDTRLERDVAIKALPEDLARDEMRLARFEREAKTLAALHHPNIASIFSLEENGDGRYLVMEHIAGATLADRLAAGPLPIDEALAIGAQIAAGVEAAHEQGVIHRDLKPGNVIVRPDGAAKVLDFGIARDTGTSPGTAGSDAETVAKPITREGMVVGTPGYMSPEQARGRSVDRRTDIFSFACVLYECLTGRPVFAGDTPMDAAAASLERDPEWEPLPARTPLRVRELLDECLEKDPTRRLRDIGDARLELERAIERREWTTTGQIPAHLGGRKTRGSWGWIAATLIGPVVVGAGVWLALTRGAEPAPPERAATRLVVSDPAESVLAQDSRAVAISHDGRTVLYQAGMHDWRLRRLDREGTIALRPLAKTGSMRSCFFSPDDRWIGFWGEGALRKMTPDGSRVAELGTKLAKGAVWTETRGILLSERANSGISRIDPEGGEPTVVTVPDLAAGERSHRWPAVLPGERHALVTVKLRDITTFDDALIALVDLDAGTWTTIIEGGSDARYVPTGHIVYAHGGNLLAVPFDLDTLTVADVPPVIVEEGVVTDPASGLAQFDFSDNGTLVFMPGDPHVEQAELQWVDRAGNTTPTAFPPVRYYGLIVSPDRTRIATTVWGATDAVYVLDIERDSLMKITHEGNCAGPVWTPDGAWIVFNSDRSGASAAYMKRADGTGEARRLALPAGIHRHIAEIDGVTYAVQTQDGDIWMHPLDGPPATEPLIAAETRTAPSDISPDGRWLCYLAAHGGQQETYITRLPSAEGRWQVSVGGSNKGFWKDEDTFVFKVGRNRGGLEVDLELDPETGVRVGEPREHWGGPTYFPERDASIYYVGVPPANPPDRVVIVLDWFAELERKVPVPGR